MATPQIPDELVVGSSTLAVSGFEIHQPLDELVRERRIRSGQMIYLSSNHDGWYAKIELKDGILYLMELATDVVEEGMRSKVALGIQRNQPCIWFTGTLRTLLPYKSDSALLLEYEIEEGIVVSLETRSVRRQEDSRFWNFDE